MSLSLIKKFWWIIKNDVKRSLTRFREELNLENAVYENYFNLFRNWNICWNFRLSRRLKIYLLRSRGTRSFSKISHWFAKWRKQSEHAKILPWESIQEFSDLREMVLKHGKCIAWEFMPSAEVDSHCIDVKLHVLAQM